ncbi:MAG: hypothetical protein EXQ96_08895 [Alphaproteobacteria bacterium]|nr:hypothetical protein [Alphaproteobacteria bacterium]
MVSAAIERRPAASNPMEIIEQLVAANDWPFERYGDDELVSHVSAQWCEYSLWFAWRPESSALYFSCALDMKVPTHLRNRVYSLLARANDRMWLGHFELWEEDGLPMFRHTLLAGANPEEVGEQIAAMVRIALTECERFYPAFQYVVWGGKDPAAALEAAMVETVGEA